MRKRLMLLSASVVALTTLVATGCKPKETPEPSASAEAPAGAATAPTDTASATGSAGAAVIPPPASTPSRTCR